jgi:hypothetical protein
MKTSAQANTGKLISNIVFWNSKKEIISFKQFDFPVPSDDVNPESHISIPFKAALVQFEDGSAYVYKQRKTKSATC